MKKTSDIINKLSRSETLTDDELLYLLSGEADEALLFEAADKVRQKVYGKDVYIRGLIEISNFCKNNCLYCGIRKANDKLCRYRLTKDDIIECAKVGYDLGFRTFVLQGGEDEF